MEGDLHSFTTWLAAHRHTLRARGGTRPLHRQPRMTPAARMHAPRRGGFAASIAALLVASAAAAPAAGAPALPRTLHETGLFVPGTNVVAADKLTFAPQYPLWSDGTTKRRWLYLPPGTAIDATQPDAWDFPPGTRLWKEFRHAGPVETRYIERLGDGSWRFATYVWNAQGTEAQLAPEDGIASLPVAGAPRGRYTIPSRADCRVCHEGAPAPVLGFTALQLSPDRDSRAPHAEALTPDPWPLPALAQRGQLRNAPRTLLETPPRIPATTPDARAALGYLHGNCGHCHNANALPALEMSLAQETGDPLQSMRRTLESLVGRPARFREAGAAASLRIVAGYPEESLVVARMRSTHSLARMPPLGVQVIDAEGVALVERWIRHDLDQPKEDAR